MMWFLIIVSNVTIIASSVVVIRSSLKSKRFFDDYYANRHR